MLPNAVSERISVVADLEATNYPRQCAGILACVRMEGEMAGFLAFLFGNEVGWG